MFGSRSNTTQIKAIVFDWFDGEVQDVFDVQVEGETKARTKRLESIIHGEVDIRWILKDQMEGEADGKYLWRGNWRGWTDYFGEYDEEWNCDELKKLREYSAEEWEAKYGPFIDWYCAYCDKGLPEDCPDEVVAYERAFCSQRCADEWAARL